MLLLRVDTGLALWYEPFRDFIYLDYCIQTRTRRARSDQASKKSLRLSNPRGSSRLNACLAASCVAVRTHHKLGLLLCGWCCHQFRFLPVSLWQVLRSKVPRGGWLTSLDFQRGKKHIISKATTLTVSAIPRKSCWWGRVSWMERPNLTATSSTTNPLHDAGCIDGALTA